MLEEIAHDLKIMTVPRTRGRKTARMWEAYPELQTFYQKLDIERAKHSA